MANKITEKSNVRIQWNDKWENYSKEREKEIIKHIRNKHKVNGVVRVEFNPTNKLNLGVSNMENGDAENINTPEVQERIILSYLKDNKIDITLDDIRRLNKRVEANLVDFNETKDNKWVIKNLTIENFLSYGEKTHFDFEKLKGLTLIQGRNFSGKTTILEALLYLFFNFTTKTDSKTIKIEEVINKYNGADFAKVEGEIIIDNVEYLISREVTKKWKKDKSSYTTSSSVKFMTKNALGEYEEEEKEEDRKATDKKIKENIGSINEFLMTVVCTGSNIFDIIEAKATERGQLLTRFLGLEIFEKKEEVAKKMHSDWKVKSKIDKYSSSDLQLGIDNSKTSIQQYEGEKIHHKTELELIITEKNKLNKDKENLNSLYNNDIEQYGSNVNKEYYQQKINVIQNDINTKTAELETTKKAFSTDIEKFDQASYDANIQEINEHKKMLKDLEDVLKASNLSIRQYENQIKDIEGDNKVLDSQLVTLRATVIQLKNGTNCPECGQKLVDVDHTDIIATKTAEGIAKKGKIEANKGLIQIELTKIEENKALNITTETNIKNYDTKISEITELNNKLLLVKEKINANDMISLKIDNITVQIEVLEGKKVKEEDNLKRYLGDLSKIEKNKELDELIRTKNIEITQQEEKERQKNRDIIMLDGLIQNMNKIIEENDILIDTIKKEEHINKIFLVYLNMVGKNGIIKTIMNNSIPVLNLELAKFLRDSAEFTVEVEINIKNNEVEFWIIDNETGSKSAMISGSGYEKTIGSLAIRIVNSKINSLPKPSLLLIDEIFSTVDSENLELIKIFMEKVSATIDNVFMITHNELVKEWAEHIITVVKTNKISKATY